MLVLVKAQNVSNCSFIHRQVIAAGTATRNEPGPGSDKAVQRVESSKRDSRVQENMQHENITLTHKHTTLQHEMALKIIEKGDAAGLRMKNREEKTSQECFVWE